MSEDTSFEHVTTDAFVKLYKSSTPIFKGILREVRTLSKKKPEATMSASKVKTINRVLTDLQTFLKGEPESKYLDLLDDGPLPQMSDAVLAMVQYESALETFQSRYKKYVEGNLYWITSELLAKWEAGEAVDEDDDSDD